MKDFFLFALALFLIALAIVALTMAYSVLEDTAAYQAWQLKRFWKHCQKQERRSEDTK